jgi:hypothetical protein
VQRWEEVIELVQSQISRTHGSAEMGSFMQQLMELSLKNKRSLEVHSRPSSPPLSHRNDSRDKLKTLRANSLYLTQEVQPAQEEEKGKKDLQNLSEKALFFEEQLQSEQRSNAAANPLSPVSSFDNTGQLRRFLDGNVQDEQVEEMLRLRGELLKRREAEEVRKLNLDLNRGLSQEDFQHCL